MKKGSISNHKDYEKFFDKDSPLNYKDDSDKKNSVNNIVKAFEIALKTREFEINLYWTRANYFWLFVSAIAVGWYHTKDLLFINFSVMLLGFTVSFVWFCVSRGGKYWQDNWEDNIYYLSRILKVPVFELLLDTSGDDCYKLSSAYRYSVSKLNQFVSLAVTLFWMLLIYYTACKKFINSINIIWIEDSTFLKYFVCLFVPTAIMSFIVVIIHCFAESTDDPEKKNPKISANPRLIYYINDTGTRRNSNSNIGNTTGPVCPPLITHKSQQSFPPI
jgi:hypothetical protein